MICLYQGHLDLIFEHLKLTASLFPRLYQEFGFFLFAFQFSLLQVLKYFFQSDEIKDFRTLMAEISFTFQF
jgi:hypothetical protein